MIEFALDLYWCGCIGSVAFLYLARFAPWVVPSAIELALEDLSRFGKFKQRFIPHLNVPKAWFTQFYILATVFDSVLLLFMNLENHQFVCLSLHWIHVSRRLLECIMISRFSPRALMHISHYLVGITFYIAAPLSIVLPLNRNISPVYSIFGISLFFSSLYCHHQSISILANLRSPGDTKYAIPRGRWFDLISCPHFLFEILIYAGLWIFLGCQNRLLFQCVVFTTSNQVLTALQTHEWYKTTFPNYPRNRRAILPWIL